MKLVGAAYLVWLGLRTVLAARRDAMTAPAGLAARRAVRSATRRAFREGVLVEAMIQKTAAFFLAFVPQFVDPAAGPLSPSSSPCWEMISVVLNTLVDVVVAYAAGSVRTSVARRPGLVRRPREASGAAMVASAWACFARGPAWLGSGCGGHGPASARRSSGDLDLLWDVWPIAVPTRMLFLPPSGPDGGGPTSLAGSGLGDFGVRRPSPAGVVGPRRPGW